MTPNPSSSDASETDRAARAGSTGAASNLDAAILESDIPLSQSLIWRRQRDSYAHRALKSWTEDRVPEFITNNPLIAEIYARIIFGFICDCMRDDGRTSHAVSDQNPVRILELGAGPGKFSFLLLRSLEALLSSNGISFELVRYCMTDCSEGLMQSWRTNPRLSTFVERGILQSELLDVSEQINSPFLAPGTAQTKGYSAGPLVVIANYVFDSLPHDAFVIEDGKVFEVLQTTGRPGEPGSDVARQALDKLQFSYRNVEIATRRYPDPTWNSIIESYRRCLPRATILFPSQALKTLQAIGKFTDGTMLVLAADKGYVHEEDLCRSQDAPKLEFHSSNCFSQMVNFDAIAKCFEAARGKAFLPEKNSSTLNICAFLQSGPGFEFSSTKSRYQEVRSAFGPDDLFALFAWLNPHMEGMSVPQILSLLRLTRWDPTTLVRLFPVLARQIRSVTSERNDLRDAVRRTWANHFAINSQDNVLAFYCGVILLELHFFEEAASMFKQSQELLGPSATTSYNLGLCSMGLAHPSEALSFMREACDQDPAFEPARLARSKLEAEILR